GGLLWTRAVFLSDGASSVEIAGPDYLVHRVDGVSPAINIGNLVAFCGTDSNDASALYIGDGISVQRIIGAGDTLLTDRGLQTIQAIISAPALNYRVYIDLIAEFRLRFS